MDAIRCCMATFLVAMLSGFSLAQPVATKNFVVVASSQQVAQQVSSAAEQYRRELALLWLGKELPPWSRPCPIQVKVSRGGAGGKTSFTFFNGNVSNWSMEVEGSLERILDSVLPHEITHTVFASHFAPIGRPSLAGLMKVPARP